MTLILLLYLVGIVLIVSELFVPGLIVGTVGAILVVYSIIQAFSRHGIVPGVALTLTALVALPTIIFYGLKRLSLKKELSASEGFRSGPDDLADLAGKQGIALTMLRPVGTAEIAGRRLSVVAETGSIEKDARIVVVKVDGSRVVVRET